MNWIVRALLLVLLIVSPAGTQAQETIALLPYTSEAYGIESVMPEGWTDVGQGVFARQQTADDPAIIVQQSAPLAPDAVMTALLPQLLLTEAPEPAGTHEGGALNWTLYQVDVSVGSVNVTVDLALAARDAVTYIVLMQSPPEEYATLHDLVFLPTLDAFAPLAEVSADVPYDVEEVTFTNGDVTLAGTLTLPPTPGPHPAVVLVSGSGPQNRDESLGGGIAIRPFRLLADALTPAGVAVLRYDDRGVGESTGVFSEATVNDFATDAEAAIAYLLTREEIDPAQIGLLGHSEGGLVAAMLGARNDDLAFIIALAGPGVAGRDVLVLQNELIMAAEGATPEQVAAQRAFIAEVTTVLDDPEAVERLVYEHTLEQARALPDEEREALGDLEEYARIVTDQAMAQFGADWFASFIAYDPAPDWAQTTVPVLAIFGGKDLQVDAEQNAAPLLAALMRAGNRDVEIVVLPDANHLFQAAGTGSPTEYASLPAEFTPDLVPAILGWVERHVAVAGAAPATPVAAPPMATPVATP
jgi:pimeloyl-ACP methyl ester carboxylesterase